MPSGQISTAAIAEPRYVQVAVAGAPPAHFCVDPSAGDPVAEWFCDHGWIDEPVQRAFVGLVKPGDRVVDLGCHLGTFSLAASALGASVLAVDAAPTHAQLVRLAAARNHFDNLHVVHGAVADDPSGLGHVDFVVRGIHGHLRTADESLLEATDVPVCSVDRLLEDLGWNIVQVVKMDIEGSEVAALRSMRRLFERGCRPAFVVESNLDMLAQMGSSVVEMRSILADLGYEMFLIDHLRPGVLVETAVQTLQTESASDLLALWGRPADLGDHWKIQGPLSLETTVVRVLDQAAHPAPGYRRLAASLLRDGPPWLRQAPGTAEARRALDVDIAGEVRRRDDGRGQRSTGREYVDAPAPRPGDVPDGLLLYTSGLSLTETVGSGLEYPPHLAAPAARVVLRDVFLYVRAGETLAVVGDDPLVLRLLLSALVGAVHPAAGTVHRGGKVVPLVEVAAGLEPSLSVRDNALVFGAFLGGHTRTLEAVIDRLLAEAGLAPSVDMTLREAGAEAVVRLALAVGLECATSGVLLVGDLPPVTDEGFAAWSRAAASRRLAGGTGIVQVVRDASELILPAQRVLWLHEGAVRAVGHAASIFEAVRLHRLGLDAA